MTSYMYNPSQKVTEILSKFLEFDPAQLELGIWSGDLSLKNVNLRQDAINPILNKKARKHKADPKTKPPLHMKLVSGSVGSMRIRIPWKRLVWGQGAVQLEISDVMIVLSLESREETEAKQKADDAKAKNSKKNKDEKSEKTEVRQSYREAKQRRLREMERRHLQGMPVALWLEAVHRKNSIEKDAAKLEKEGKKHKKVEEKREGYLDRWMKNTTSDFFWRFYVGLQGSIKKARIVVVQDGVEVGCIIQSVDVLAGKDEAKMTVSMAGDEFESMSHDFTADDVSNPQNFVYEGAYEDGEHVDKVLKQEGVGVFVRKEASMAKVPQTLRFSNSVTADDYVLRPVNLNLNFSFFYPHPPERRKKKAADSLSQDTKSTAASTTAQSTTPGNAATPNTTTQDPGTQSGAASVSDSTTNASSKRRRGKRDRIKPNNDASKPGPSTETSKLLLETAATLAASSGTRNDGNAKPSIRSEYKDRIAALAGDGDGKRPVRRHARAAAMNSTSSVSSRPRIRRHQSARSLRSYQTGKSFDEPSLALGDLNSVAPGPAAETQVEDFVPRFDCYLGFDDIRVVFSSRHYEMLNHFLSTVARMKNGRPDSTIVSVLDSDAGALHRRGKFDVTLSPESLTATIPKSTTSKLKSVLLAPLVTLGITSSENGSKPNIQPMEGQLPDLRFQVDTASSLRSQVTRKWWNYAIGAVVFELRKRKSVAENFQKMYLSFDWDRQRYKRQEYIDLYMSVRLGSQPQEDLLWTYDTRDREAELLLIEDELPLEQILLYRSIARSLRVRGFQKMPSTVHELNGRQPVAILGRANRRGSVTTGGLSGGHSGRGAAKSNPNQLRPTAGESTLLSMLHGKYEFAKLLRSKSGITGKVPSGPASENVLHGDGSSYIGNRGYARDRRKASMGFDSSGAGDSAGRTPRKSSMGFDSTDGGGRNFSSRTPRNASIGYDSSPGDAQPGQFYTSSRSRDNSFAGDFRTVATNPKKTAKHSRVASVTEARGKPQDESMKITFSVQVKSIDLMILREEFIFDFAPEMNSLGHNNDAMSREYFSGEESSADDVSELSFLTDDQRFFNEQQGQMAAVAEEEENDGAKLSSTDFLNFGLPENTLLRMTISPLAVAMRGRSEGAKHLSLSVGRITAHGENAKPLLSVGREDSSTPLSEVDLDLPPGSSKSATRRLSQELGLDVSVHKTSFRRHESLDNSSGHRRSKRIDELGLDAPRRRKKAQIDGSSSAQSNRSGRSSGRAVSLGYTDDEGKKTVQCDFALLSVTIDLDSIAKLIQFYLNSEILYPDKVVAKSSNEAARKFMVTKTAQTNPTFGNINSAVRILGLEVRIPFALNSGTPSVDHVASEASSLYSYGSSVNGGASVSKPNDSVTVLAADAVELYGGSALDDMCAAQQTDFGTSKSSMWSGSLTSRKVPVKTLEMLDLAELTANHDSFSSHHWVATLSGIECVLDSENPDIPKLTDIPLDVELLVTVNEQSLLETESPKHQFVVEVSPVQVLLSAHRLDLLGRAISKVDFRMLDGTAQLKKRRMRRKRDPPRIETLSRRVLHSVELSCKRVRLAIVDDQKATEHLSLKLKEVVMEECISDFLSVVSCFDFSLPNEEALSSAMQICIGRLVGLGLSDDEAWGCTNAARLNLLDDIALMRRAHSDALEQLEGSIRKQASQLYKSVLLEEEVESESESQSEPEVSSGESLENSEGENASNEDDDESDEGVEEVESDSEIDDDDSANSAEIVDTTLGNAVEKTMAAFAPLLMEDFSDGRMLTPILVIDLPLGARLSTVKLFYDNHLTSFVPSVVITNAAGIELLTLVPSSANSVGSGSRHDQPHHPGHGILFSRFDVDKNHSFGKGGLPMSALLSDSGDEDEAVAFRERSRLDDIELGEMELLFTAKVYDEVIEEISKLRSRKETNDTDSFQSDSIQSETSSLSVDDEKPTKVDSSSVVTAFCLSALMTSDSLIPFSRLTLEGMMYKNKMALLAASDSSKAKSWMDIPTFMLLADSASLQNLTPEGQFYPDAISLLSHNSTSEKPFQFRYYKSPDPWKFHSRLNIELRGYRVFLIRQFIHELLQFFVYDRYGVGRLKKKYSKPVSDMYGNGKPPLLYSVTILDSSVLCPRSSTNSDMVAFEVDKFYFGVSYHPESFAMPTQSSHFDKDPGGKKASSPPPGIGERRNSSVSVSDYFDCQKSVSTDEDKGKSTSEPISSFNSSWRRRFNISLERVRIYTVIAFDSKTRDVIESPLFRFFHAIDGRAAVGKSVYCRRPNVERQPSVSPEALRQAESHEQHWDELSTNYLNLEVLADNAPHTRILIADREGLNPFSLNARLSQFCLLVSCWDHNMQEMPCLFTFATTQVKDSASPPNIPDDFPAYATEEFVSRMEQLPRPTRSEICVIFKKLQLRCTFDDPGSFAVDPDCFQYFPDPACPVEERVGLVITFSDAVVHVVNDFLNIKRIGVGASSLLLLDERRHASFRQVLSIQPPIEAAYLDDDGSPPAWANLKFGLREDIRTLNGSLPMPFQLSVFMAPGWSMINVGANRADGIMHDMSWIWLFLDFFTKYYKDIAFGNPGHQAQRWAHKVKNSLRKAYGQEPTEFVPIPGSSVDFRMWLCQPYLCVPSEYRDPHAPCLRLEGRTGLWYRFKSIRDMSSHEVVSTDIDMYFLNEFREPKTWRRRDLRNTVSGKRPLVEGLSFGLRYDCNNACNHKDITVKIPFVGPSGAVTGRELEVQPILLPSPTVCTPIETPHRVLGPKVCEITSIIEVLPVASATLMNFFKGPPEVNEEFAPIEEDQGPATFSACVSVRDLRIYAIDPVLGVQLPVAVLSIGAIEMTASKFAVEPSKSGLQPGESPPEDLHLTADCHLWADYFKLGITRSWEPLVEPYKCLILCENSKNRGQGMSLESDNPLHLNLSSALLQVLGETIESFSASISETFGEQATTGDISRSPSIRKPSPSRDRVGAMVEDEIKTMNGVDVTVFHEIPKPLKGDDRVAFSLRNLTGQKIRVHQQSDVTSEVATSKPAIVTYLNQVESMGLTFNATISVIKNLSIVEVPYPGLPNSRSNNRYQGSLKHAVDVQVPGFRWLQGIKVDTFGRKFEALAPRSVDVRDKIFHDWRLKNAMMLLTEVGLESGGRSVTVRSLFEVRNSTTHALMICFNPDPTYKPVAGAQSGGLFTSTDGDDDTLGDASSHHHSTHHAVSKDEVEIVEPGESFQLPTLLLERALQMPGSHLGCVWMCPDIRDANSSFLRPFHAGGEAKRKHLKVGFSSRPVQLAKVVHESSLIFQSGSGDDIPVDKAKSGVQVSCPTRGSDRDGHAPFCYAIEVGRSPIVSTNRDKVYSNAGKDPSQGPPVQEKRLTNPTGAEKKAKKMEQIHGPVAYTLSIHAPLIVVNLLPEGGRFELMHAIRRTVLWYADLQPGQQIPVHSVGLDAPLLLLVNLGFCRTPVGEGALVHHGADGQQGAKARSGAVKSIGKVVTKGTKHIGKTLTAISDSPDKRQGMVNKRQNAQLQKEKVKQKKGAGSGSLGLDTGVGGIEAVDGKVHSVESVTYAPTDVATDTTVVDGVGQRLTLNIENVRGGGGQRRISLYCPFWIVNTTDHSLRYKQEKGNAFVSGTVLGPSEDGSTPVDGSNRNYRSRHRMQHSRRRVVDGQGLSSKDPINSQTIFSGTPGALATAYGRCDLEPAQLANLIDKGMPLETLARIAFMFNFHEDKLSIGQQTLCVQLFDGTGNSGYLSEWSRGFSLDSVGFSQIVGMNCKEGRTLELSVTVNVAPGFLSGYTKIVRFLPRYVVLNRLERPIRLWQDSSVFRPTGDARVTADPDVIEPSKESRRWRYAHEEKHHRERINQYEALYGRPAILEERKVEGISEGTTAHRSAFYITTVGPSELLPFHLPDSSGERQLRVDMGAPYNVTASVAADFPGEHTLMVPKAVDLRLLNHVSTRAAPKYKIVLPPPDDAGMGQWDGELGVFFETDWGGDRKIIVKGTKRGKYAFNHTDIHVGDELLRIDGISVVRMSFAEAMKLLKERLTAVAAAYSTQQLRRTEENPKRGQRRLSLTTLIRRGSGGGKSDGDENSPPQPTHLSLTFRTLEERLRKVRVKAGREGGGPSSRFTRSMSKRLVTSFVDKPLSKRQVVVDEGKTTTDLPTNDPIGDVNIEMKSMHNTMFVILRPQDTENPPFCIQNRSINYIIFYRQRGCESHPWNLLKPGESKPYSWEEPMKSKKLTVRVASNSQDVARIDDPALSVQDSSSEGGTDINDSSSYATSDLDKRSARTAKLKQALAYQFVDNEERGGYGPSVTVRLEEIGFKNFLPTPANDHVRNARNRTNFLNCEVDTDGGTRLLVISDDDQRSEDERGALNKHVQTLEKQIAYEEERRKNLYDLRFVLTQPVSSNVETPKVREESFNEVKASRKNRSDDRDNAVENDAKRLVEDYPEDRTITRRDQVVVEVQEAVGLNPTDFIGGCNPYCEVSLKGRSESRKHLFKKRHKQKTYFIEKCLSPKWKDQIFVFDVPRTAVRVTRGHSIEVKLRNFRLVGQHSILGQASVHFGSLRDQKELEGWYPLAGRAGRRDVETASISEWGRGSVKLRVQWIYTIPALLDYFLLLAERRLVELTKSRTGMTKQLAHALASDQRKREARDNSGAITKLAKLKQKKKKMPGATKPVSSRVMKPVSSRAIVPSNRSALNSPRISPRRSPALSPGRMNRGIGGRMGALQQALKMSRDKYLYALHFQTVESRRNRQGDQEELLTGDNSNPNERMDLNNALTMGAGHRPMGIKDALPMIKEIKSPMPGQKDSLGKTKKSLEAFFSSQSPGVSPALPFRQTPEKFQSNQKSLDDFFSQQKTPDLPLTKPKSTPAKTTPVPVTTPQTPGNRRGSGIFGDKGRRISTSHRRISLDIDMEDGGGVDDEADQWEPTLLQGQAIYESIVRETDFGISDLMSVNTDQDDELKRKKNVMHLMDLGFVFHGSGEFFHANHLPHHFRRALFADSLSNKKSTRLYRPKWAAGSSRCIRQFKNYQAANNIFWDAELEVVRNDSSFTLQLKDKKPATPKKETNFPVSKLVIAEKLTVPAVAPKLSIERSQSYVEFMALCRDKFERACKRSLKTALNPGGWLTIRPITALNLPDTYTGMHVKLRYGSEVISSETVDAKVTPRWTSDDFFDAASGSFNPAVATKVSDGGSVTGFKHDGNDLVVPVEPQQTSGSIKISVMAERMNTKSELGVLHIPLGAAISACIDCVEEGVNAGDGSSSDPPVYIRWFPLMSPRTTVPVEGDMGLSTRPKESEKVLDSMFQQYFAPCIQLALIWSPDSAQHAKKQESVDGDEEQQSATFSFSAPETPEVPTMEKYMNADIGRISAALIDSQKSSELLSFSAVDIDVRYSVTKSKTRIGLVVGWIQLDNQEGRTREPVVLAPTPALHRQPTLQILAVKDNLRSKSNIVSYDYIGVALQEMDLTVEESWIFELWEFFMGIMRRQQAKKQSAKGERRADVLLTSENCFAASDSEDAESDPTLLSILESEGDGESPSTRRKVYIEQLILGLVKLNLSYVKGKNKQSWELSDEGARKIKNLEAKELQNLALTSGAISIGSQDVKDQSETFVRWSQHTYDEELLAENGGTMTYNLPGLIAAVFPSVSEAPIRLQGKAIDHVFESPGEILSSIKNFYVNETLKQVYKIIGSLDFVGNPTVIFSSFVSGVKDLVVAPTTAFLKSPTNVNKVGIGVAKGTISLFSHSASGIFGFVAKASATAGQAAAILSLDAEYSQWHREQVVTEATNLNRVWKRRGVQSVSEMVTRPVGDILLGVAMGASGVFLSPYQGLRRGGTLGLVRGVAAGTAGVVTKPLVGVLDALTHFTATAHDIARSVNVLERRYQPAIKLRLPYNFGPMKILSPFDPVTARSVYLLKLFPSKTRGNKQRRGDVARWKEIHIASEVLHMEPDVETYAIATTVRVVLIKLKKDNNGSLVPSFCWEVDLTGRSVVSSRVSDHGHNGVALTITMRAQVGKKKRDKKVDEGNATKDGNATSFAPMTSLERGQSSVVPMTSLERDQSSGLPLTSLDRVQSSGVFPSSRSVGSYYSTGDASETDEYLGDSRSVTGDVHVNFEPQPGGESEAELDTEFQKQGATRKDGEVLEWFTVLSEYQHRPQLTNLHNAISNIVGDFNAVIVEPGREAVTEGVTTFGMFEFESGLPDGQASQAANTELVVALESLPWMHETVFKEYRGKSRSQQRQALSALRQNWVFSRDLEASIAHGGPAWLVEARARAMFVAAKVPAVPEFIDQQDPVISEVLQQLEQGNISVEQATELLYTHQGAPDSDFEDNSSGHHKLISSSEEGSSVAMDFGKGDGADDRRTLPPVFVVQHEDNLSASVSNAKAGRQSENLSVPEEKFGSLEFKVSDNLNRQGWDDAGSHLGSQRGSRRVLDRQSLGTADDFTIESQLSSGAMAKNRSPQSGTGEGAPVPPSLDTRPSNSLSFDTAATALASAPGPLPATPSTLSEQQQRRHHSEHQRTIYSTGTASMPHSESRMDRMEVLMEQLVILNASQAHRQASVGVEPAGSDNGSVNSATKIAKSLRSELADLKAQVVSRTQEDEALRSEISLLRQQLAERRTNNATSPAPTKAAERDSSKSPSTSRMRFPNFGPFGTGRKHQGNGQKAAKSSSPGSGGGSSNINSTAQRMLEHPDLKAPGQAGEAARRDFLTGGGDTNSLEGVGPVDLKRATTSASVAQRGYTAPMVELKRASTSASTSQRQQQQRRRIPRRFDSAGSVGSAPRTMSRRGSGDSEYRHQRTTGRRGSGDADYRQTTSSSTNRYRSSGGRSIG